MTLHERDRISLRDIADACRDIHDFVQGMTRDEFVDDLKTQAAVLHRLLIIGEAVKRLSDDCLASAPDIPWKQIARTRDILIHHYEEVDLQEVWNIADRNISELHREAKRLLNE